MHAMRIRATELDSNSRFAEGRNHPGLERCYSLDRRIHLPRLRSDS